MANKYLLDSDVCLDAIIDRKPFSRNALSILYLAETKKIDAVLTSLSFSNMFYLLSRWSSKEKAYSRLMKLRKLVSIANVSQLEVDNALNLKWKDFEDALQYYSALSTGCDAIITRNIKDYKNAELPVLEPNELLKLIQ